MLPTSEIIERETDKSRLQLFPKNSSVKAMRASSKSRLLFQDARQAIKSWAFGER